MSAALVIFLGPSLRPDDAPEWAGCFRPPARQGDVYRAARERPPAIGLIDGYFDSVPSVWHKELLWALSEGIPVWGAASLGALRAAELAPFGMRGVGAVFEAYRDGLLEDDDEVALLHGPAETAYAPVTEAMVNVRATVEAARAAGLLDEAAAAHLVRTAKAIFYKERTWRMVLEAAGADGLDTTRLAAWLPEGRVDLKRRDALALLAAMAGGSAAPQPDFAFPRTVYWEDFALLDRTHPLAH